MRNMAKATLLPLVSCFALSGCVIHIGGQTDLDRGSITSVLGSVTVPKGKNVDDITSVNGNITISDNVTAKHIDTVNGSIELGRHVSARSLTTVNGDIDAKENLFIRDSTNTVNGDIELKHAEIQGEVNTVNGDIELAKTRVGGDLTTHNGNISLVNNSIVQGDLVFERKRDHKGSTMPTLTIDASSTVEGKIILYREIELNIATNELASKVVRKDNR